MSPKQYLATLRHSKLIPKPEIDEYIQLYNKRFHYVIYGSKNKQAFLLIHGWSGSYENFRTWIPILSRKFKVVIPDLPGCNLSASLDGKHTLTAYAQFLKEFMVKLKIRNFYLGGICSGASIAMEYVKKYPADVKLLFLHTPPINRKSIKLLLKIEALIAKIPMMSGVIRYLRKKDAITYFYKSLLIDGFDTNKEDEAVNMKNRKLANQDASLELILDVTKKDYSDVLKKLKIPIYVLMTKNDALIRASEIKKFVQQLPRHKLEILETGAHGWSDEFIERQNKVIEKFFA